MLINDYVKEILNFMFDPKFNLDNYFKIRNISEDKERLIREKISTLLHKEININKKNVDKIINKCYNYNIRKGEWLLWLKEKQ